MKDEMKAHWWSPGFQAVTWVGCFASHRAMAMAPSLHREQMESQLEKEARFRQLMAHSSHDSAIDTDSMEWETEVVEFERETVSFLCVFSARSPDMKTLDALSVPPSVPVASLEVQLFLPGRKCILSLHLLQLGYSRWFPELHGGC